MKTDLKIHTMEIPKEVIARFFTKAERDNIRIELLEVVGLKAIQIDLVYKKDQRENVMLLTELVDEYLLTKEEQNKKQ